MCVRVQGGLCLSRTFSICSGRHSGPPQGCRPKIRAGCACVDARQASCCAAGVSRMTNPVSSTGARADCCAAPRYVGGHQPPCAWGRGTPLRRAGLPRTCWMWTPAARPCRRPWPAWAGPLPGTHCAPAASRLRKGRRFRESAAGQPGRSCWQELSPGMHEAGTLAQSGRPA